MTGPVGIAYFAAQNLAVTADWQRLGEIYSLGLLVTRQMFAAEIDDLA